MLYTTLLSKVSTKIAALPATKDLLEAESSQPGENGDEDSAHDFERMQKDQSKESISFDSIEQVGKSIPLVLKRRNSQPLDQMVDEWMPASAWNICG